MNLIIRGDQVQITEYVIEQIPFIKSLYLAMSKDRMVETDESQIIRINTLSPQIVSLIVEYFRNDTKLNVFKEMLNEQFDENCIKKHLQYLGLNELFNNMYYGCSDKHIMGKLVICDIIKTIEQNIQEFCIVTYNGNLIPLCSFTTSTEFMDYEKYEKITIDTIYLNIENTMIRINSKINKNKNNDTMIHFESGDSFLRDRVIENNRSYFVDSMDCLSTGNHSYNGLNAFPYSWLLRQLKSIQTEKIGKKQKC